MKKLISAVVAVAVVLAWGGTVAFAANTPTLNQTINAGTLTTDILNSSRVAVVSPSATLAAQTFSFNCQTSTGTLGDNNQRIYVTNPDAADSGWSLTMAATGGATALWTDGGTNTFDFNDAGTAGCTDGADTDTKAGQLTVNANAGTLTADCSSCTTTNVTKGSSTGFVEGTTNSVNLLTAAAGSDDVWRGYLTGVGLSQTIPAEQPVDSYSINMTITVAAS